MVYTGPLKDSIKCMLSFPCDAKSADFDIEHAFDKQNILIHDGRDIANQPTLESSGFSEFTHNITFEDSYNSGLICQTYKYIQNILKDKIPHEKSLCLGHIMRDEENTGKQTNLSRPVANFVHADWHDDRICQLTKKIDRSIITNKNIELPELSELIWNSRRYSIFNIWIPLNTVTHTPLALCDMSTVSRQDIITEIRFKNPYQDINKRIMILSLKPNKKHKWYYYPLMKPNNLLIFQQFDSLNGILKSVPVFHTALKLPRPKNLSHNFRKSIEFRFILTHAS